MKHKDSNSNRILSKTKLIVLIIISTISLQITNILIAQTFTRITTGAIVNDSMYSTASHWVDYDNDGDLDISVTNANGQDILVYRNDGNGTFTKISVGPGINGRGSTWGDYDNDGDLDCFVAVIDKQKNLLYRNDGNDTFTRITTGVIVNEAEDSYGGSWGDYDNDGDLDLFVANGGYHGSQLNFLYNNKGDGTFIKVTTAGNINTDIGRCLNGNWGDYDNDGDLDLFVSAFAENNRLYRNNGDGTFTRITSGDIVNDGDAKGSSWGDYDNDGDLDLFVASDNKFLYQNNGDGTFTRIADAFAGSDKDTFGSSWGDFDNDGDLDLFLANKNGTNFLYQNNGDGTFTRITTGNIVTDEVQSYGSSWGDFENDGDLDLFVANGGFEVEKNNFLYANNGNPLHWINIKCFGTISNSSAIGAKVRVKAMIKGKPIWQLNEISALTGGGYGGQNSLNAEFGLGDATIIDSIKVQWPSGRVDYRINQDADQFLTIIEAGDSLALVALYNSTNGTNWTNKTNWLTGQPISSWYGITVSNGRVTEITLGQNNLVGTIPAEIGNLTDLVHLDFSTNGLSGSIPPDIGNLTNLQFFTLEANELTGTIPSEIGNLSSLTFLRFDSNKFEGTIPIEIGNLRNLTFLYLTNNKLSGSIPTSIGNLSNLEVLYLSDNTLSGSIPVEIGNLRNLQTLGLSNNKQLSGVIPTEIGNLTNLISLGLDTNQLLGSVPTEIRNLTKLTELYICSNQFIDLPDLSPIKSLKILRIEENKFTFEDIEPNISVASENFTYSPQDNVGTRQDTTATFGSNLTITVNVGGANNQYQWYKDGAQISGATNSSYAINQVDMSDAGAYTCEITNTVATELILYSRPINVTILDTVPPQITHTTVTTANSDQSQTVSATLTDNVSIRSATLYYRKGGASSFAPPAMKNTSGDTWEGTIPASFITERGTEYYISASDVSGNTSTYPESEPQSSPLVIQVNFSNLSFTKSTPAMAYQMISVPVYLDSTSPSSVLKDDLGNYDDTQWRLLQYNYGTYNEYPNISNFHPGKGFWLITRESKSLDTGSGKSVTTAQNYQINLQPGWNQIGNPYAFTVNWSDVIKDGNVESQLVGYSGSSNDESGYEYDRTQLVPFEGYFVKNNSSSETTIEIPPKSASGSPSMAKHSTGILEAENLQRNEWILRIKAKSGRYVDRDNYIGVLYNASDQWDSNDFSEAPFFEDLVSLYFPHLDWDSYPGLYTGDFRSVTSEGHYWDFNVKTNTTDSEVTLALTHIQNLPPGWEIVLLDRVTHTSLSFLELEKYSYIPGENDIERKFRIVVGQAEFIDANDLGLAGIPQDFFLSQNYPNPFNLETRLNYELPKLSDVNIAVFNLNGQLVKTLFAGPRSAGRYVVSWDGKTQDGSRAVSGVYLVRMKAGNFMAVTKILLVQ